MALRNEYGQTAMKYWDAIPGAHAINQIRNTSGIPLRQRNYYEHIIRDENELNRIREYITNNPLQWIEDENNPMNIKTST